MNTAKTTGTIRRLLPASAVMTLVSVLGSFVGLGSLSAIAAQDAPTNEEVTQIFFDELHKEGADIEVLRELTSPDAIFHASDAKSLNLEEFLGLVTALRASFPDAVFLIEDMVLSDDAVAVRWTMNGTHEGGFAGIAPTGVAVTMNGIGIVTFQDGEMVENWVEYDRLGLLQQIGAFGATPEAVSDRAVACTRCAHP